MLCEDEPYLSNQVQISHRFPSSGNPTHRVCEPSLYWQVCVSACRNRRFASFPPKFSREAELAARSRCTLVFFSWPMQILFAISVISFLALVWAAVAITQWIRTSHKFDSPSEQPQREFGRYLFAAVEREHPIVAHMQPPPRGLHDTSISNSSNLQPSAQSRAGFIDKATSYHRE